jgi:cellulose synthase/poly-beta-1,6-N-acetylglucosamine synthase-like glycosyltransferase
MSEFEQAATSTTRPVVSVILTCFEHERFLVQALEAVRAQTYRPIQLIVTDDASADGSATLIARWLDAHWPAATFIRHDVNAGVSRTLNEALRLVTGDFVTITSADDWMEPQRLGRLVAVFDIAPDDVGLVYSGLRVVDSHGRELALLHTEPGSAPSGWVYRQQLVMPVIPTPSVMVRRSVYKAVGGFNEDDVVEDYDMWLRICRSFHVQHVPEALVNFRWHDRNTTTRIQGDVYDRYEATCLRRQLGYSEDTDRLIRQRLDELGAKLTENPS